MLCRHIKKKAAKLVREASAGDSHKASPKAKPKAKSKSKAKAAAKK
jgi:hypothetical protein